MNNPWKKMTPAEHYDRLLSGADREAWDHLSLLVAIRLRKICVSKGISWVSLEDQTQETLMHIWNKMKSNGLHLRDNRRFYGLLKVIVARCLTDTLRGHDPLDDAGELEEFLLDPNDTEMPHMIVEARLTREELHDILEHDSSIPEEERLAVMLQWDMDNGENDLKNNSQLAERLSLELGAPVSYEKTATLLTQGKKVLCSIAREKWKVQFSAKSLKK